MTLPTLDDLQSAAETVYAHMTPTPQIPWPLLSRRAGCTVWVKHENHTPIGAFKVRGGLVYMDALRRAKPDVTGVVAATRGNHGQSIAYAAARVGLTATVVVPHGNNPEKNAAMIAFGGELVEHGEDFQAALDHARALGDERGLHTVPSFDFGLAQGVGTYSLEFLDAVPDMDTVYVPIGLGSGICGMIAARDALGRKTEIIGVVAEQAATYALSFREGRPVPTNSSDTLADGLAVRVPDETALDYILKGVERVVRVSEDEILEAVRHYLTDTHNLAEGAGAAPLAALLKERDAMSGKTVGLVLSGGNADQALIKRVIDGGTKETP
jgi:threonine dehydratase